MSLTFIVFDCDGTLVDSQHAITTAMVESFETLGHVPPARQDIMSVVGISLVPAIARLMPDHEPHIHDAMAESYKSVYGRMRASGQTQEILFDGAHDAVTRLSGTDALLGVATGKSRRGAENILKEHGLRHHFLSVRTADDGPGKPDPHMLKLAMADVGADPHETIMIGDTTYDMEMARAAGAGAIGVSWGYHPVDVLHASGAHEVIDDFASLDDAVARVRARLGAGLSALQD
jgi:phosphoglycolate phosphatase